MRIRLDEWYLRPVYGFDACRMGIQRALCDKYPLVLLSIDVIRCRFGTFTWFGFKSPCLFFANVIPSWDIYLLRSYNYYLSTGLSGT